MKAQKLWFADERIFIETDTGDVLSQSLKFYPRLLHATEEQRSAYRFSPFGIHWAAIDEDVSFESFAYDQEPQADEVFINFFKSHPELNVTQVASIADIPRTVFAQYLCGAKKPSERRLLAIQKAVNFIGQELSSAKFV